MNKWGLVRSNQFNKELRQIMSRHHQAVILGERGGPQPRDPHTER